MQKAQEVAHLSAAHLHALKDMERELERTRATAEERETELLRRVSLAQGLGAGGAELACRSVDPQDDMRHLGREVVAGEETGLSSQGQVVESLGALPCFAPFSVLALISLLVCAGAVGAVPPEPPG